MPTRKFVEIRRLPTVGAGLSVRDSQIPKAGNGLFADRAFAKGEVVTFVDGPVVSDTVVRDRDQGLNTHVVTLMTHFLVVDALREPKLLCGGGSFANDAMRKGAYNVRFEIWDCADVERFGKVVVLRALRDIAAGEEVFVSYGPGYWRKFMDVPQEQLQSA